MAGKHSALLRGISAVKSPLFQGRFGRMFRNLPPAQFGASDDESDENLTKLGAAMVSAPDTPKDGKDDEESGIPALYTYFGQFIDHDITFDPMSSLLKQNDPDALVDFRNPALDLDNVYGRGPNDQPYMYDADGRHFLLGDKLEGANFHAHDLPRNAATPARALIGDPRNDENAIVSQLQGLFLRFHNRLADDDKDASFEDLQQQLRFHYQYLVLNDFLPRIVSPSVLDALRDDSGRYDRKKLEFFHWHNDPFMPIEFSVAAYRLGHSMVRPGYRLNDGKLLAIFPGTGNEGLTGFEAVKHGRAIDWGRFIDIDLRQYDGSDAAKKQRLQFAYRIDTALVGQLGTLPAAVASDPPPSLASRNLLRGWRLGLPSGQDVARAMAIKPLDDNEILIGQGVDSPDSPLPDIVKAGGKVFAGNCPLWTYVLAEAMHHKKQVVIPVKEPGIKVTTPQLGPVGGRIVAEVLLGLMFGDPASLLSRDPLWVPKAGKDYALKDFVKYALGL